MQAQQQKKGDDDGMNDMAALLNQDAAAMDIDGEAGPDAADAEGLQDNGQAEKATIEETDDDITVNLGSFNTVGSGAGSSEGLTGGAGGVGIAGVAEIDDEPGGEAAGTGHGNGMFEGIGKANTGQQARSPMTGLLESLMKIR